jgi:hypothetical protein
LYEHAVFILEKATKMLEVIIIDSNINDIEVESPVPIRILDNPANDDDDDNSNKLGDIIVCESEARTEIVVGRIRQLHAPYIRFRILLCEGMFYGEGDAYADKEESSWVTMRPLWCSLGDYDNVLGFRHILNSGGRVSWAGRYGEAFNISSSISGDAKNTINDPSNSSKICKMSWGYSYGESKEESSMIEATRPQTVFELYNKEKYASKQVEFGGDRTKIKEALEVDWGKLTKQQRLKWTQQAENAHSKFEANTLAIREAFGEDILDLKIDDEEWPNSLIDGMDFNLMVSAEGCQRKKEPWIIGRFADDPWGVLSSLTAVADDNIEKGHQYPNLCRILPCCEADGGKEFSNDSDDSDNAPSYFHFDSEGKTCFTATEAKRATKRLSEMNFFGRLIEGIKTTKFALPQQDSDEVALYCNERVYGKFTVLQVTGVVKLE